MSWPASEDNHGRKRNWQKKWRCTGLARFTGGPWWLPWPWTLLEFLWILQLLVEWFMVWRGLSSRPWIREILFFISVLSGFYFLIFSPCINIYCPKNIYLEFVQFFFSRTKAFSRKKTRRTFHGYFLHQFMKIFGNKNSSLIFAIAYTCLPSWFCLTEHVWVASFVSIVGNNPIMNYVIEL